ncbi:MAG: glycosyltransferase family 2 protein [Candidatus Methylomirabilis sp.]|nr:glycosyltransferase family 2 protein [Deltaproteobacteria bacterium]
MRTFPEGLTIVIPAYNEEGSLRAVAEEVRALAAKALESFEIVIVDDGSRDGTRRVADALAREHPQVRVLAHARNSGSGVAIKTGVAAARYDKVMYIPADGQFRVSEIGAYLKAADRGDIVIGARLSRSDYSPFRLLSSKVFIVLVNFLFDQRFRDVNWVHLWRREIFERVRPISDGVFLLEEILVRARAAGYRVVEIDSVYQPRRGGAAKGSKLSTIARTLVEMGRFWISGRFGGKT